MVTIDLRKDAVDLRAMIQGAVRKYSVKHRAPRTAKKHPPVTRIDLIFSLADGEAAPWVHLHFDTKPGSEPDGDPTHPDFAELERGNWLPAVKAVCEDEKVSVIQHTGKRRKCGDAELTETIGSFLVDMLLVARADGVLAELPRGARCELGVEDPMTGEFGWPAYEDRGKKNLVK
jgi:hypothetical protein